MRFCCVPPGGGAQQTSGRIIKESSRGDDCIPIQIVRYFNF